MTDRFELGEDGRAYREQTFSQLALRYRPLIHGALEILNDLRFEFADIDKVHAEQLRPELLFRHALPFCITEDAYFDLRASSPGVLAALLAGHTLALTHLDYHLDGSDPDPDASATARKVDPTTAAAYAIRMVYAAGQLAEEHGGRSLFREAFATSGFVILRMHQDWAERYSVAPLADPQRCLKEYLDSPDSRLMASGYWEAMVRGSFASHDERPPPALLDVVGKLRQLRQLVDELADFADDVRAGLATTPLLFALTGQTAPGRLSEAVRALWSPGSRRSAAAVARVRALVTEGGGFSSAAHHAEELWRTAVATCTAELGAAGAGFVTLLDLKMAKLSELRESAWTSRATDRFFP